MQGTWVQDLIREDPTCRRATKPVHHNYWACALEPTSHNYWAHEPQLLSPCATTTEARTPRARALQQEKPPQWEAHALQRRVDPLATTRESPHAAMKTQCSQRQISKRNKFFLKSGEREKPTTKCTLPSKAPVQIWQRNQKLYRKAKAKRVQHHQTSFTTNAKGTSPGRKEKATMRNKESTKWESSLVKENIQ